MSVQADYTCVLPNLTLMTASIIHQLLFKFPASDNWQCTDSYQVLACMIVMSAPVFVSSNQFISLPGGATVVLS